MMPSTEEPRRIATIDCERLGLEREENEKMNKCLAHRAIANVPRHVEHLPTQAPGSRRFHRSPATRHCIQVKLNVKMLERRRINSGGRDQNASACTSMIEWLE